MTPLPDEALVVRGGQNLPSSFVLGSGVAADVDGKLRGISVNSAAESSLEELTAPDPKTGYPGIPHNWVGVTTIGAVRSAGGDVVPAPTRTNPHHATMNSLTPGQASDLFRPTVPNPTRRKP
jgi:hypothetical protein